MPATTFLEAPKSIFFRLVLTALYEKVYVRLERYPMLASLRGALGRAKESVEKPRLTMGSDEARTAATAASTPRFGRGEFIVYLDVDGVVHPEDTRTRLKTGAYIASPPGHTLFEHVPLLEQLLAPYPSVKIVLSTSWIWVYRYSRVVKRFPPALRARMIGATFHRAMDLNAFRSQTRGQQVWSDVVRRQPRDWIALDDDCDWPEWCRHHHIPTHPVLGISEPSVRAAIERALSMLGRNATSCTER